MPGRDHTPYGGCEESVRQHSCTSTGPRTQDDAAVPAIVTWAKETYTLGVTSWQADRLPAGFSPTRCFLQLL